MLQKNNRFKIYFTNKLIYKAWGGGNNFLRNLINKLKKDKLYTKNILESDSILFNSHQNLISVLKYKIKFPEKFFIHRIDGPLTSYRGLLGYFQDKIIFNLNQNIADGTFFLSKWSFKENLKNGLIKPNNYKIIHNAANNEVFKKKKFILKENTKKNKIKLIAASWSSNYLKGFDVYNYLDKNLNFSKYEMIFIGNSPVRFNNIKIISPKNHYYLYKYIRRSDIFIFASKIESCSNLLLEAMSCGIPILLRNASSNLEIFNGNGVIFENDIDSIKKLEELVKKYNKIKTIKEIKFNDIYYKYIKYIYQIQIKGNSKRINYIYFLKMVLLIYFYKVFEFFLLKLKNILLKINRSKI